MPAPREWSERADIETATEAYARRFAGPIGAWFLAVQEATTLGMLAPDRDVTVLDVGGGHGQTTAALFDHGYRVTVFGSDHSCAARIQTLLTAGRCAFDTGDVLALPYADRAFHVVISLRFLPHVTRWRRFLSELARVAAHAVILDYPALRSLNRMAPYLFGLKRRLEGDTRPFALFHEHQLLEVLEPLGFACGRRTPQFFLPMAMHRALGRPRFSAATEAVCRGLGLTARFGSPVILQLVRRSP
jgi:2-polyprenyl-3-methyl-5-hydroxy-6-metoxy-1,4-benzoquinol methylase